MDDGRIGPTYGDVLLVPKRSAVDGRDEVDPLVDGHQYERSAGWRRRLRPRPATTTRESGR